MPNPIAADAKRIYIRWSFVAVATSILATAVLLIIAALLRPPPAPLVSVPLKPLVPPPPEIPERDYSASDLVQIRERFWDLKGAQSLCTKRFVDNYHRSAYEYCESTDAGGDVGGGCAHLTGGVYLYAPLLEAAMQHCNVGK